MYHSLAVVLPALLLCAGRPRSSFCQGPGRHAEGHTEFETSLAGELKEQVQPVLSKVLTRLCNPLVNKFCVRGGPPQLLSALQHTFEWLHEEAPLRTWLRAELTKHVDLSFVCEV